MLEHHLLCPYCKEDPGCRGSQDLILIAKCENCDRLIRIIEMPLYVTVQGEFEPDKWVRTGFQLDERDGRKAPASVVGQMKGIRLVKGGKS